MPTIHTIIPGAPKPQVTRPECDPTFTLRVSPYRPEHDKRQIIIRVWDHEDRYRDGRVCLTCEVRHGGQVVFPYGQLYAAGPRCGGMSSDGFAARELVLSLVSMRPGDTDREYFDGYTTDQLDWVREHGEALSMYRDRYCDPGTGRVFRSAHEARKFRAVAMAGYHSFGRADNAYGSFEVYYIDRADKAQIRADNGPDEIPACGWYWRACFPGCLPDSDPCGPFKTSGEAYDDAQDGMDDDDDESGSEEG